MIAAAQVHTIKTYGPDRIAGFSPIPAMSMVSHCVGTRFTQLIGGVMTSFYDWYADLPVASPQVFGDQTDVPESGDWWDATYLMMWGSNVPVTRTPDAHWMAEVRYRGTKIVTVSPDYADNTKFADEWLPAQAGTDAALAMAMGHVILKEFFVDRQVPFFADHVKTYTDLPFLITLTENAEHGGLVPGKFLTEVDLEPTADGQPEAAWKTVLLDAASGKPVVPNGSMGFRYAESGVGRWNLDLEGIIPALSIRDVDDDEVVEVLLPCFEAADGSGRSGLGTSSGSCSPCSRSGERNLPPVSGSGLGLYQREQDRVADAKAGQVHDQPVDSQSHTAGGRHPVLQSLEEVLVDLHRLGIAGGGAQRLGYQALPLLQRVGQLGIRGALFGAEDHQVPLLRESRVVAVRPRER
jgi:Molybdopterin oxidoreductase